MDLIFGKYKGLSIKDPNVPTAYLEWLYERMTIDSEEIKGELARREQADTENLTWAQRLVRSGYRAMLKEYESDNYSRRELAGAKCALEAMIEEYFDEHGPAVKFSERLENYAQEIINDKLSSEDDIAWARNILNHSFYRKTKSK